MSAIAVVCVACADDARTAKTAADQAARLSLGHLVTAAYQEAASGGHAVTGVSVALVLANGTPATATAGFADREKGLAMSPESVLLAGSIGKTYVSAVIHELAHRGALSLDDKVRAWLGDRDWFDAMPNADSITVSDLARHRSGLPHHLGTERMLAFYGAYFDKGPHATVTPVEVLSQIAGEPALFEAGSSYQYSDLNYLMLGLVIEAVTGKPYFDVLEELFLAPLKLDEHFAVTGPRIPRLVPGYLDEDMPFDIDSPTVKDGLMVYNPALEWTGGGLATTAADLARWIWLLGSGRAMSWDYLPIMLAKPSTVTGTPNTYAAGLRLYRDMDAEALGHGGAMPGYRSYALYFPVCDIGLAMQVNDDRVDWQLLRIEFVSRLMSALESRSDVRCR